MLIKNIYPDIAGALNSFFVIGDIYLQKGSKKLSSTSSLLKIKNGKSDGTTAVAQIIKPSVIDCIYLVGFNIKIIINKRIDNDKIKLLFLFFNIFIFIVKRGIL